MLSVSIGFWILNFILFNFIILQKDERFDLSMLFVFPLFKLQDSIVFILATFYGVFYKIPIVLIEERVNLQENQKIKKILETKNKDANKEHVIKINNEFLTV
jgi:predicted membrane protein